MHRIITNFASKILKLTLVYVEYHRSFAIQQIAISGISFLSPALCQFHHSLLQFPMLVTNHTHVTDKFRQCLCMKLRSTTPVQVVINTLIGFRCPFMPRSHFLQSRPLPEDTSLLLQRNITHLTPNSVHICTYVHKGGPSVVCLFVFQVLFL